MKKILYTLFLVGSASFAAQAQTTVKKVILEDFTGTWCGWCPEGTVILEQLAAANPTNFIPVASHNGDGLEIPDGAAIDNGLNVTGYPNGAVDRFQFPGQAKIPMSRSLWTSSFNTQKAKTAIVSVSFENAVKTGADTYSATVKVKFSSAPTAGIPLKMNVYLLEDSIAATGALAQGNYSSNVQAGADPLTNWFHNHTLRKALGGAWGFSTTIPASPVVGTTYSENITFTIPAAWVAKHINVVAFVAYDGPAASNQKEILNAEQYKLKYWYPTAVNSVTENLVETNIYPNPAKLNSFVKFSFNLMEDANVTMEVINTFGQVVSRPYSSFEIKGAHTIQWSASENGSLVPGMYFVRLTTDKGGSQVNRLILE
jgi:thiol-disulfide isomerase/thioredoxin